MALKLEHIQIGWISALPIEALLAEIMLDELIEQVIALPPNDNNIYTYGRIKIVGSNASHIVAIAQLPLSTTGKASAATVANNMRRTFPNLKFGIMVGIAGGVWTPEVDVRLGDIVVGVPDDGGPGIIQYDHGKAVQDREFVVKGTLNKAPDVLRSAAGLLQRKHMRKPGQYGYTMENEEVKRHAPRPDDDNLFSAAYVHQGGKSCEDCDKTHLQNRSHRTDLAPKVHYGVIASGDQVVKDAVFAEKIRKTHNIICIEMEAAGLDAFPCLVVRGISDYADTHKNDDWHAYAAGTAAAYAKELLSIVPLTAVAELPSTGNTHWKVPRAPNPLFTGRRSLLDKIKTHLITAPSKEVRPVFVLQGIGGAGKSEAAIKFATENKDNFWGIFWIDADNRQSIEKGFADIAEMQTPPLQDTSPGHVMQWLANTKELWLLILDKCDDSHIDFATYMPAFGGCVIITTRLKGCRIYGTWENIDDLDLEDATQLLLKASGIEDSDVKVHTPTADSVVSLLGQHALALVHAGAYIRMGHCTLSEYIRLFAGEQNRLLRFEPNQLASRYGSVYATFEVSATALAISEKHDGHLALKLLNILAFLDREAVEEEIFDKAFDECHILEAECRFVWEENEIQWSQYCTDPSTQNNLIANNHNPLAKLDSFASMTDMRCSWRGAYHRSREDNESSDENETPAHASTRSTMQCMSQGRETFPESTEAAPGQTSVHEAVPTAGCSNNLISNLLLGYSDSGASRSLVNACDKDCEDHADHASYDDGEIYRLTIWHCNKVRSSGLVDYHKVQRLRDACVRLAELSLISFSNRTISMHPLVHDWARNRLDKVARQDAWEQALSVLALVSNNIERKPFSLRLVPHIDTYARDITSEKSRAQLSLNVVRAFFFLALMYYNHGRYEESLAVYETLSVSFKVPPHTWSCKSSALLRARARCLDMLRRHEDMYSCVNQILQTTTRWFKPDSPEAYTAQALLADTHHLAGNFQDEADLCESLYERNSRTFVLDDRNTSELLTGLIDAHRSLGNHERAMQLSVEQLQICQRVYPPHHPSLLRCMKTLARLYLTVGALADAVTFLEEEVNFMLNQTSQDLWCIELMSSLAEAYGKLGRYDQANPILEEMQSHYVKTTFAGRSGQIGAMHDMAVAYLESHKPKQAVLLLEEVVEMEKLRLPLADPERLISINTLARAYLKQYRPEHVVILLEEAVKCFPATSPRVVTSMTWLAQAYLQLNKPDYAVSLLEEVVRIERSSLPADHADRLNSMDSLAHAYLKLDKPDHAVVLLEEVVRIEESSLPAHHLDRLISMRRLANAYLGLHKPDQAIPLLEHVAAQDNSHLEEEDINRLKSVRGLALAYTELGTIEKIREAIVLLEEVMGKGPATLHANPDELRFTQERLADAQEKLRRISQHQNLDEEQQSLGALEKEEQSVEDFGRERGSPDGTADRVPNSTAYQQIRDITKRAALMF